LLRFAIDTFRVARLLQPARGIETDPNSCPEIGSYAPSTPHTPSSALRHTRRRRPSGGTSAVFGNARIERRNKRPDFGSSGTRLVDICPVSQCRISSGGSGKWLSLPSGRSESIKERKIQFEIRTYERISEQNIRNCILCCILSPPPLLSPIY